MELRELVRAKTTFVPLRQSLRHLSGRCEKIEFIGGVGSTEHRYPPRLFRSRQPKNSVDWNGIRFKETLNLN